MKAYEYKDAGGRVLCINHDMLRCGECSYIDDLEQQNKRYREVITDMNYHRFSPDIIEEIYQALEDEE